MGGVLPSPREDLCGMSGDDTAGVWIGAVEALGHDEPRDLAATYQAWFRHVYRWIRVLGGPAIDAEDIAQEVFIVVHRRLPAFDGKNLAGWLYRIAQRAVRDHRRRAWYRNVFLRPRDVALDEVASSAAGSDERLEQMERERRFYHLVQQIHPRWRDSFLLFEIGGLSGDEIAQLLGIPAATVRTHLFRARKQMLALVVSQSGKEAP
jgi:RNA polymerase sigma-70 factor (ECF subfamily)